MSSPIWGPAGFVDTFGALSGRPDAGTTATTSSPRYGAPVLAVADGIVFSVGWNTVGGSRLWLVDGKGNEFYYAHLSAYSPLAVDGAEVKAGDVLGFVGNSGDARGTPFHLHFEIHPEGLLGLGYDGAVDPTSYLHSWPSTSLQRRRRLRRLELRAGRGAAPGDGHLERERARPALAHARIRSAHEGGRGRPARGHEAPDRARVGAAPADDRSRRRARLAEVRCCRSPRSPGT